MDKDNIKSSQLDRLQKWYLSMCNGSWEHTYGITLQTVDNPGWWLQVDLEDSYLSSRAFVEIDDRGAHINDWLICSVQDKKFVGYCGPENLNEMLVAFLDWACWS